MSLRILSLGVFVVNLLTISSVVFAEGEESPGACSGVLSDLLDDQQDKAFAQKQEVHSLMELVDADPAKNLAVKHPSIVMNASQRLNAWVEVLPSYSIPDPLYGAGEVTVYPIFSGGVEMAGGKQVIGALRQIHEFVQYVKAAARGDGAAVKMPVFTGPSGTGKSEFLTILGAVATHLTSEVEDYYLYTFRFKNLKDIPGLRPFVNIPVDAEGNEIELPREDALKRSPLVLLPKAIQQKVVEMARERAIELGEVEPTPVLDGDPQTQKIIDSILAYYSKTENDGKELTNRQVVEYLSRHVDIVRRTYSGSTAFPKLGAQGKNVPYGEIFFQENSYVMTEYGPGEAFSYILDGKVLQGDGGILLLDEWFRNQPELRDAFLDFIEDRELQRGGSPTIPTDMVVLGATNDESIDDAKSKGTAKAHLDRIRALPLRLSVVPWEVAKTMLLMKGNNTLLMRQLGDVDAPENDEGEGGIVRLPEWEPGNINELYPLPTDGTGMVGPEGRWAVSVNMGPGKEPVFIAPHTIAFMSHIVAASRMETDVNKAAKLGQYGVIKGAVFADEIQRLKALTGKIQLESDEQEELHELHNLLREGQTGVSNRDAANAWLKAVIDEAQKPENGNTATPAIALEVFQRLMNEGGITYPDQKTRLKWMQLAYRVGTAFVIPWIEQDVMVAMSAGGENIDAVYDEIKFELLALSENRNATRYSMPGRSPQPIKKDRLEVVKRIYKENTGRNLEETELMNFHTRYQSEPGKRHPGLRTAISTMLARLNQKTVDWDALASYGRTHQGNADVASRYSELARILIQQLGYNEESVQMALEFGQQLDRIKTRIPVPGQAE